MKITYRITKLLAFCFFVLLHSESYSQDEWHKYISAPNNVVPKQLEVSDDGTLYAFTVDRKIYYRESGSNWQLVPGVYGFWNVTAIGVDPETNRLFVCTSGAGIQYTDNFGQSWQHEYFYTSPTSGFHESIYSIAPHPTNNTIIMQGGFNPTNFETVTYRSTNNGNSWNLIESPAPFAHLFFLNDTTLYGVTYINGIYKSNNYGDSWTFAGMDNTQAKDLTQDQDGTLYAAVYQVFNNLETGIYRSLDNGQSWEIFNVGLTNTKAQCVVRDTSNNKIYCGTENGIYELINETWVNISTNISNSSANDLAVYGDQLVIASRHFGAYTRVTNSTNWANFNQGFNGHVGAFAFKSNGDLIGGATSTATLSFAETSTNNWSNYPAISDDYDKTRVIKKNPSGDIFILDFNDIFRSTDDGDTFVKITPDIGNAAYVGYTSFHDLSFAQDGKIVTNLASDDRAFFSTDNGDTWEVLVDTAEFSNILEVENITVSNGGNYYLYYMDQITEFQAAYSENGNTWANIDISPVALWGEYIQEVTPMKNDSLILSINQKLFFYNSVTHDFTPITIPWESTDPNVFYSLTANHHNHLYLIIYPVFTSIDYEGIWQSKDMGETWKNIGFPKNAAGESLLGTEIVFNNLGVTPFISVGINADNGIYYYGEETLPSANKDAGVQAQILLYPNPIKRQHTLHMAANKSSFDHILILNTNGQILNNICFTEHQTTIPIDQLNSGNYYLLFSRKGQIVATEKLTIQ